ncbi:MAG TPA: phosphatidate cytidylyltransferase [Alphaproteobacteria bacterium]
MADRHIDGLVLRTLSALVLAPLAAGAILAGWPFYHAMVGIGCAILAWEWGRLCGGVFTETGWVLLGAVLAAVAAASLGMELEAFGVAVVGAFAIYQVALSHRRADAPWFALGVLYLAIPGITLIWLRTDFTPLVVLWLFLSVWASDVGAYAAGRLVGGPKLAPQLSPNKTWAGFFGGIAAAMAMGVLFFCFTGGSITLVRTAQWAGLSVLVAIVSQGGDLTESAIKRHFKVKDTSGLIPGHGGLFDRVDGLLAAAPVVALIGFAGGGGVLAWR